MGAGLDSTVTSFPTKHAILRGTAQLSLPRRILARRAAQSKDPSFFSFPDVCYRISARASYSSPPLPTLHKIFRIIPRKTSASRASKSNLLSILRSFSSAEAFPRGGI